MIGHTVTMDVRDGTAYDKVESRTLFFRKRFNDGCILAFYSDNPWGNYHNQERGWVVIDGRKRKIIDEVTTYFHGSTGNEYNDFLKRNKEKHGGFRPNSTWRESDGEVKWKMEE